jgi:hypothetical protein
MTIEMPISISKVHKEAPDLLIADSFRGKLAAHASCYVARRSKVTSPTDSQVRIDQYQLLPKLTEISSAKLPPFWKRGAKGRN